MSNRFVSSRYRSSKRCVLQVWPLAVGENLKNAHSNGVFSVAMAMYP